MADTGLDFYYKNAIERRKARAKAKGIVARSCNHCGGKFYPKNIQQLYCSFNCKNLQRIALREGK